MALVRVQGSMLHPRVTCPCGLTVHLSANDLDTPAGPRRRRHTWRWTCLCGWSFVLVATRRRGPIPP